MRVDLCWLGRNAPSWGHGNVSEALSTPSGCRIADGNRGIRAQTPLSSGMPPSASLYCQARGLETRHADVVHAGLRLGTGGHPKIIDFIEPTAMWSCDPDSRIEATSWRMSLRACFIRSETIRQLGAVHKEFETLDGAALELGHRYLTRGAFVRHDPWLLVSEYASSANISLHDEILFARQRFGDFWTRWALGRGLLTGVLRASDVVRARHAFDAPRYRNSTLARPARAVELRRDARVTVLIPTIERYSYLRALLPQLALQTFPAHEILIIDQTPGDRSRSQASRRSRRAANPRHLSR